MWLFKNLSKGRNWMNETLVIRERVWNEEVQKTGEDRRRSAASFLILALFLFDARHTQGTHNVRVSGKSYLENWIEYIRRWFKGKEESHKLNRIHRSDLLEEKRRRGDAVASGGRILYIQVEGGKNKADEKNYAQDYGMGMRDTIAKEKGERGSTWRYREKIFSCLQTSLLFCLEEWKEREEEWRDKGRTSSIEQ